MLALSGGRQRPVWARVRAPNRACPTRFLRSTCPL